MPDVIQIPNVLMTRPGAHSRSNSADNVSRLLKHTSTRGPCLPHDAFAPPGLLVDYSWSTQTLQTISIMDIEPTPEHEFTDALKNPILSDAQVVALYTGWDNIDYLSHNALIQAAAKHGAQTVNAMPAPERKLLSLSWRGQVRAVGYSVYALEEKFYGTEASVALAVAQLTGAWPGQVRISAHPSTSQAFHGVYKELKAYADRIALTLDPQADYTCYSVGIRRGDRGYTMGAVMCVDDGETISVLWVQEQKVSVLR